MQPSFSIVAVAALLIYVIAAPDLVQYDLLESFDNRRALQLLVLALGCLSVAVSSPLRNYISQSIAGSRGVTRAAATAFITLGIASSVTSTFPTEALLDVTIVVSLILTATALAHWATDRRQTFRLLACGALTLSAAISATHFAVSLLAAIAAPSAQQQLFPAYLTPRFFSQWQTWTLPLVGLPLSLLPATNLIARVAIWLVVIAWWAMAFLSGGRGTLLCVAGAGICLAFVAGPTARQWLRRQAPGPIAGAVVAGLLAVCFPDALRHSNTLGRFLAASDSGRLELWQSALDIIATHPLLGVGPLHYAYVAGADVAHPHNVLLQFAAEWGLPAAAGSLVIVALALRAILRGLSSTAERRDRAALDVRYALTTSLLAAIMHTNLSGLFIMPLSQTASCLVCGWLAAEMASGDVRPRAPRWYGNAVLVLSLTTLLALLMFAGPAVEQRSTETIDWSTIEGRKYRPRIWRDAQTNFPIQAAEDAPVGETAN